MALVNPLSFSTPWADVNNLSCLFLSTRPEHDLLRLCCRHPGTFNRDGTQVNKNWHLLSAYYAWGTMLHSWSLYFHTVLWSRHPHYPPLTDEQTSFEKLSVLSPTGKDSKVWTQAAQPQCLGPWFLLFIAILFASLICYSLPAVFLSTEPVRLVGENKLMFSGCSSSSPDVL